jgi:hypothetical protein
MEQQGAGPFSNASISGDLAFGGSSAIASAGGWVSLED